MFTLCFVALFFVFCLNFISHSSCTPHASLSLFIPLSLSLTLCLFVTKRGRVCSRLAYRRVLSFLYDSCAHFWGEKFYFVCTFVGERYSIGEMHIPRGRRHCGNKKTLFCLFFFMYFCLCSLVLLVNVLHLLWYSYALVGSCILDAI